MLRYGVICPPNFLSFPPLGQGCFKYPPPPLPLTNGLLFNLTPFLFYAFSNTICYVKLPITDRDYIQHLVKFFFIAYMVNVNWQVLTRIVKKNVSGFWTWTK